MHIFLFTESDNQKSMYICTFVYLYVYGVYVCVFVRASMCVRRYVCIYSRVNGCMV